MFGLYLYLLVVVVVVVVVVVFLPSVNIIPREFKNYKKRRQVLLLSLFLLIL